MNRIVIKKADVSLLLISCVFCAHAHTNSIAVVDDLERNLTGGIEPGFIHRRGCSYRFGRARENIANKIGHREYTMMGVAIVVLQMRNTTLGNSFVHILR